MASYVVYLMGQSNCWGSESLQTDLDPSPYSTTPANCFIWDKIAGNDPHNNTDTGEWAALTTGFGFQNPVGSEPDRIGCELQLAHHLITAYPADKFYFIKCARGGTPLAASAGTDWAPGSDELYKVWNESYNNRAIEDIYALVETPLLMGVAWIQGAADAASATDGANYATNLTALLAQIRTDLGVAAAYVAIQRERNLKVTSHPGLKDVRAAAISVAAADADADWFDSDERFIDGHDSGPPDQPPITPDKHCFPSTDGEHYTGVGQSHLGTAIARLFIARAQATSPPTIPDPTP